MKILITSDNHLGFKENDPIRGDDSYRTFEEILKIANEKKVDMILQGGDLFHENRPSRGCLSKTVGLFRKYCFGEKMSELKSNVCLNTDDPNISVSIPVVIIHGNHDDPSGVDMVSPIDILESAKLVNYIGKHGRLDIIEIIPLLIEKEGKVAIYGLGHIKERRLYKMFVEGRVLFQRPADSEEWYNILVVHQNRVVREKGQISEKLEDGFFDLIVYGHEHESLISKFKGKSMVIQPGSTVRTSFLEAECYDKYVYVLDVNKEVAVEQIKLCSVRPLAIGSLKIEGKQNAEEIVETKVKQMITRLDSKDVYVESKVYKEEDPKRTKYEGFEPSRIAIKRSVSLIGANKLFSTVRDFPLVRLKVEIDEGCVVNKHRVIDLLTNVVVNPQDAISLIRKPRNVSESKVHARGEKIGITRILEEGLKNVEFGILSKSRFCESLDEFVKGDKDAFNTMIRNGVERIVSQVDYSSVMSEDLEFMMRRISREQDKCMEIDNLNQESIRNDNRNIVNVEECRWMTGVEVGKAEEECLKREIKKDRDESSADGSFSFSKYL
ncbi:putative subunit of Mre11 [Ordospora colligata]|uniref:Putative subunit of Mre11 n=1 Tax=Ordospora colligata OC4 TaxID=1354746 RepID=A0A0B2UL98_9MICR|nr:putative subunit of Mre11 [Ordospora colligata OC4]KHN69782.1 putative subunit of Mre11 [Ordospora colligata OC4]TBU15585.1 putative subunit of Mre11 [Ordospora colligata]TBU15652.1 putative subunit of Mre11 [Ordospora colligata]TBU18703.1 putative subunit of Mre11 [Ordospora colligata]